MDVDACCNCHADPHRYGRIVVGLALPRYPLVAVAASLLPFLCNLAGLPHPSAYDNFLIVVGFAFNGLIVWYAWTWRVAG